MATTTTTIITNNNSNSLSIFMLPLPGFSHISPLLELAKKLAQKNILIYFCSSPILLTSIKHKISDFISTNKIQLVECLLPTPEFPDEYDMVRSNISKIIRELNPNLAIFDIHFPCHMYLSVSIGNIPSALFSTTNSAYHTFNIHMSTFHRFDNYPFSAIYLREYEIKELYRLRDSFPEKIQKRDQEMKQYEANDNGGVSQRISFILVKTMKELEGKYIDYFSVLTKKKVVPVGSLIEDTSHDDENLEIMKWLDRKNGCSTVLVTFGSGIRLSQEETIEIAHGLELSGVNFIWYILYPGGEGEEECTVEDVLPEDFLEKVGEKGRVLKGWAPQKRILGHSSLGGFVSHCGWASVLESISCGIPIIGLPMLHDQPITAKLVEEIGVGVEIVRDGDGKFDREQVGKVVKEVVGGKLGQDLRKKTREVREEMKLNGQSTTDGAVEEVIQFMENNKKIQV